MSYLEGILAPYSHCSILIETPMVSKAGRDNDVSIVPMGLTNSKFDQLVLYLPLHGRCK